MTKLRIREYKIDDFLNISPSRVAKANQIGQPVQEWGEFHKVNGLAATVVDPENQIVFCLGVHHKWSGCGEVWAVYSPFAKRYPNTLRVTQLLIECLIGQFGYYRLQAVVDIQFQETIRFIEHLKFKREGLMRSYGPHGEDRILYALVKEGKNGR